MKHILMLNYEFPPLGGGAGNATYYLLREFAKIPDLKIDLVTSSTSNYKEENFADNIKIYYLDISKKSGLHYQSKKDLLIYSWKSYWFCKKLIKQNNYDIIHSFFGVPCGYVAMRLGLPFIVSLRGSDVPFYNKRFYWLDKLVFKKISRKIWRNAKVVVANSEDFKKLALKTKLDQKIEVIYNGVDNRDFFFKENKEQKEFLKIITVGRLIERKGYSYLIEAVRDIANLELTIIGGGPLKDKLVSLVENFRVKATFLGEIDHSKIASYLQESDLFVIPSLNEGMSNAVLEAIGCGLPVIATDTGGSVELINGNGIVVQKGSAEALRLAIMEYLKQPILLEKHGEQSKNIALKMSWKNSAQEYLKLYNKQYVRD